MSIKCKFAKSASESAATIKHSNYTNKMLMTHNNNNNKNNKVGYICEP